MCLIGYALFSDSITVTGTATAGGDFSDESSCTKGYSPILQIAFGVTQDEFQEEYTKTNLSLKLNFEQVAN